MYRLLTFSRLPHIGHELKLFFELNHVSIFVFSNTRLEGSLKDPQNVPFTGKLTVSRNRGMLTNALELDLKT